MKWWAVAGGVVVLAACGGQAPTTDVRPASCDATVMGACIVSLAQPYDAAHVERSIRMALQYWNAPEDTLAGWAIVFRPDEFSCGATPSASGCTYWDSNRTIELQVLDPGCPETAQLVHEVGHVLHHDGGHKGPWWSWTGEQNATWDAVRLQGASPGCARSAYYLTRQ